MDLPDDSIVSTSHIPGAMTYPSTTQALFALIVMIIVLLFILVYCCWGTFSCARQEENSSSEGAGAQAGPGLQQARHVLPGSHAVIVPINNMLYIGDPESQCIYEIPLNQDKPPTYTEVLSECPPPPYTMNTSTPSLDSTSSPQNNPESRETISDLPPPYDACLSNQSGDGEECRTSE